MLVATSVTTDARVMREAEALADAGHEVHIVGLGVPAERAGPSAITISTTVPGSGLRRYVGLGLSTAGPGPGRALRWLLLPEHRNLTFARWARQVEAVAGSLRYDVVHAHDFTALEAGSRLAERRDVPLVYDAHELWSARHRVGRPTPWQRRRESRTEARLGSRARVVITVGEALAGRLQEAYGWQHVVVVRNTFPSLPPPVGEPAAEPAAAVYAGRLAAGRDLGTVARASRLTDLPLRLVGPADRSWAERFDPGRCSVLPALGLADVDDALTSAGLALVTLEDHAVNHRIALPNKLFHAVRAGVPVVASDVGELARTVRRHGLGTLYRPGSPGSLARAIAAARSDYPGLVAAVRRARQDLSWDADRSALLRAYERLAA